MLKRKNRKIFHRIPKSEEEKELSTESDLDSSQDITWRIFRIMAEFVTGFHFITRCAKAVSFFGSARISPSDRYYKEAMALAWRLGKAGFKIVTGGGPGIMEAANKGAKEAGVESIGLNIQLPLAQRTNKYVTRGIGFHYFFTRKVMLSAAGQAYVFFPGGYGTLDEFFDMMNLIQTKKMEKIPVVLYGKDFWFPLAKFLKETAAAKFHGLTEEEVKLFAVVDSVDEAFQILKKSKPRRDF